MWVYTIFWQEIVLDTKEDSGGGSQIPSRTSSTHTKTFPGSLGKEIWFFNSFFFLFQVTDERESQYLSTQGLIKSRLGKRTHSEAPGQLFMVLVHPRICGAVNTTCNRRQSHFFLFPLENYMPRYLGNHGLHFAFFLLLHRIYCFWLFRKWRNSLISSFFHSIEKKF